MIGAQGGALAGRTLKNGGAAFLTRSDRPYPSGAQSTIYTKHCPKTKEV